jgi:hypothetical protein
MKAFVLAGLVFLGLATAYVGVAFFQDTSVYAQGRKEN